MLAKRTKSMVQVAMPLTGVAPHLYDFAKSESPTTSGNWNEKIRRSLQLSKSNL